MDVWETCVVSRGSVVMLVLTQILVGSSAPLQTFLAFSSSQLNCVKSWLLGVVNLICNTLPSIHKILTVG